MIGAAAVSNAQHGGVAVGEARLLERLTDRLARDWPQFNRSEIAHIVSEHLASFSDASIRDYVPVLVERATDEDLQRRSHAQGPIAHGPLWTRGGEPHP
jgi:hypothetical protein